VSRSPFLYPLLFAVTLTAPRLSAQDWQLPIHAPPYTQVQAEGGSLQGDPRKGEYLLNLSTPADQLPTVSVSGPFGGKITQKISSKDTSYYNLIRRPKNNAHLFVNYQASKNFFISSSLQITGKRTDTYYDPISFLPSEVGLEAYTLWNLYAEYSFSKKRLTVFVDAKNLTNNKKYYEIYGYSVQGFNITGGIRFKI